ncbi:MAG: hypothetical protein R3C45_10335 [Phycisphaerales bacterium]
MKHVDKVIHPEGGVVHDGSPEGFDAVKRSRRPRPWHRRQTRVGSRTSSGGGALNLLEAGRCCAGCR